MSDLLLLVLVGGTAVLVGAVVQGTAGFGLAVVAAPVLALVAPELVPVTLILTTAALPLLSWARERSHVDWRGVGWLLVGRLPGTAAGTVAVALLPPRELGLLVALAVGVAVVASLTRWRPRPTRPALLVTGLVSGALGTSTSIGGPPVALLYSGESGPRLRATLAAYFSIGVALSLVALAAAGQVGREELLAAALLLPALVVGFALSGPLRAHLDARGSRTAVLVLCSLSAVALAARSLAA